MKKIFASIIFLTFFAGISFAQITIPKGFLRYGGNYPLDVTSIYSNYNDAVAYAAGGANGTTAAYKGQYISVPSVGVFYIDDNWELQDMGGGFRAYAGENAEDGDVDLMISKSLYFKIDYNTNHTATSFTTYTNYQTGVTYPTLLIPPHGQRGSDGLADLTYGGYYDEGKTYNEKTLVSYRGQIYVSLQYVPENASPLDSSYWGLYLEKGDKGDQGDAGTIEVGTVSSGQPGTLPVVTNVGTASNAILNFTIPKGDKGDPGVGLVYAGYWTNTAPYPSNTVVRKGTNLWYTTLDNNDTDPTISQSWSVFLQDGHKGDTGATGARGPQGYKGDPGYTFGIYGGAWDTEVTNYPANTWVTWSNGTYGVIEDFEPEYHSTPLDYVRTGQMIVLSLSGKDGTDGKNGAELVPMGEWTNNVRYLQYNLVRYDGVQYYCTVTSSEGEIPPNFPDHWEVFLKDGLNISDAYITTNAFWAGKFESVNYSSNSIVYYPQVNYGVYYVLQDCTPEDYGGSIPESLNNTNYFAKIAEYGKIGKDGAKGDKGDPGKNGLNGADGAGNMWFDGTWTSEREYPTNYIVSYVNGTYGNSLYVSINESSNVIPGVTSGWTNYWQMLVRSGQNGTNGANGKNGSAYVFDFGWDSSYPYQKNDICVVSNIFYIAEQASTGQAPWSSPQIWTAMVSPEYRFYGLSPSRYYAPNTVYVSNELVRYNGSTYVVVTNETSNISPATGDTNVWAVFAAKGDQGIQGNAGTITVGTVSTGDAGSDVLITNSGTPQNATLNFTIPRGDKGFPGANLVYFGQWNSTNSYQADSLVRYGTNLWYNSTATEGGEIPGENNVWEVYLMDGKAANVHVSTNTITLPPSSNAVVVVTPEGGGNDVTLQFKIPQGEKGDQGIQGERGIPGASTVYYGKWVESSNYPAESLVRYTTNLWYTAESTSTAPGDPDTPWQVFLQDGRPATMHVSTNTITLPPSSNAEVVATSIIGGNDVTLQFKIPRGYTVYPEVINTTTLPAGSNAYVHAETNDLNLYFDFGIPQGEQGIPGMSLVYYGLYDSSSNYPAESLVRYGTNLYYTAEGSSTTPGTDNTWIDFLKDGQNGTNATITVTGTETGEPGTQAIVTPTYSQGNTHVDLHFTIPRGSQGSQGIQGIQGEKGDIGAIYMGEWTAQSYSSNSLVHNGTNLWYASSNVASTDIPGDSSLWLAYLSDGPQGIQGIQGETGDTVYPIAQETTNLPYGSDAYVTNWIDGTNSYFYFGIPQGEKGDDGATLVPKGIYSPETPYDQYDLVRYSNAQYYVSSSGPITGVVPTDTNSWTLFLQDGEGVAANATLIKDGETEYSGILNLDTNTLVVTNMDNVNFLTVVGGVGSGASQWDIDLYGGLMPALDVTSGPWEYDGDGDMMPPLAEGGGTPPQPSGRGWTPNSRVITEQYADVLSDDYLIWMDGTTAGTNQVLNLVDVTNSTQTIIVRELGNSYGTTIQRISNGTTNTYELSGSGDGVTIDWLGAVTNWYWRMY